MAQRTLRGCGTVKRGSSMADSIIHSKSRIRFHGEVPQSSGRIRPRLRSYAEQIGEQLPELPIGVSRTDRGR